MEKASIQESSELENRLTQTGVCDWKEVLDGGSGQEEVLDGGSGQEEVLDGGSGQEHGQDMSDKTQQGKLVWQGKKNVLKGRNLARHIYHNKHFRSPGMIQQLSNDLDLAHSTLEEYAMHFDFTAMSIDRAFRKFLLLAFWPEDEIKLQHLLLWYFSLWYLKCNERSLSLHQAANNLCWAMVLLNADLHGGQKRNKMTCSEFIVNLNKVCDRPQYPTLYLTHVYKSIKAEALYAFSVESRIQEDCEEFTIYKSGHLMCKRVREENGKKSKKCRRSWKPFSAVLQGMVLQLDSEDEHTKDITIRLHHAVAYPLQYKNKPHVLSLKTADSRVFYFQAKNEVEQMLWVSDINLIAARFSAPPLTSVSNDVEVHHHRPVLPSYPSPLSLEQQREYTEGQLQKVSECISFYKKVPFSKDMPPLDYMEEEVKRHTTYARVLEKPVLYKD